MRAMQVLQ